MAAGKFKFYDFSLKYLEDGTFDMDDGTNWKAAILTSGSNANTLSLGTAIYSDWTGEHTSSNGYTTGGIALTNVVLNKVGRVIKFTCDPAVWTAAGGNITGRFLGIYKNATVNGVVKPILCVCLVDTTPADVTATPGNTWTFTPNASGIYDISGANVD
jgi:hypothetical protein